MPALMAAGAVLLTACSSGAGDDATAGVPNSTPSASPAHSSALQLEPGPLEPGTYRAAFTPAFSVELDEGWYAGPEPGAPPEPFPADLVPVSKRLDTGGFVEVVLLRVSEVRGASGAVADPSPDELVSALESSSLLRAQPATQVTVGGVPGRQLDADSRTTDPGAGKLLGFGEVCCKNIEVGGRYRFVVLDNGVLLVVSALEDADWEDALEVAQPVVDSVRFVG